MTHTVEPQKSITGVWATYKEGDVHNYICLDGALVIGWNKSYRDAVEFSDLALVAEPKSGMRLQYADANGNCQSVNVSEETWAKSIHTMLEGLKAKALKHVEQTNQI